MSHVVIGPRRAVVMELLLFFAYACFSASWMVGSLLTNDMVREFGWTALPASVNNAISAAKILGNFVAAWILMKLGPKGTVTFSCLLTCSVLVGAFATGLPFVVISRFLLGFGGAVLMICMTPYVVSCFPTRQQPVWIGINSAGPNTGNLIALLTIQPVLHWLDSWRAVVLFYGLFSALFLILWLVIGRSYPVPETEKPLSQTEKKPGSGGVYRYRDGLKEPFLYQFLFAMTGRLVVYTVLLYLFPLNPSFTVNAQRITLLIALTGIPGTIFGIYLSKKLRRQGPFFRVSGAFMSLLFFVMILTKSPAVATTAAVLLGFVIFLSTPALFALPARMPGASPGKVAVILTLYWAAAYSIQMLIYALVVRLVNTQGWFTAMLFTAFYSLTYFIGAFFLPDFAKETGPDTKA